MTPFRAELSLSGLRSMLCRYGAREGQRASSVEVERESVCVCRVGQVVQGGGGRDVSDYV